MYGLEEVEISKINGVLVRHEKVKKALLYGSRAKGNYQPYSDIDLVLVGEELDLSELYAIATELDDLLLPYNIDLSLFHNIENTNLLQHIGRVGKVFYKIASDAVT